MAERKGLIHIYCGEGKGKTSASIGLGVRAAGRGMQVVLLRLMKDCDSGELNALASIPNFTVIRAPEQLKFVFRMTEEEKDAYRAEVRRMWNEAMALVDSGRCDLLLMDEACSALSRDMLDRETLLKFLKEKPAQLEVVMTGRDPLPEICELADYISDIHKVKHPFDQGIPARVGIEL